MGINIELSTACVRQPSYLSRLASENSASKAACATSTRAETMSAETASGPTEDQVEILEYNFNKVNKHPDPTTLCLIAAEAGLSEEETQKWFKQRLAQWRQSEGLPSECRSVTD
ncbi:homeodomain-only protein isoform X1 [Artibeus jamaicensis]|uniref:homeodomain-only protein isoform X1 n=1 Tax=Artibeus jamaicensis TaxID=9417 RepID=UPI00187C8082|nr:homeodomain-only protein isoform X1 [Artibeus jamaicensis]